jgi:hypothetical protein
MLCAGEAHLLSNTTILQNSTKPKGPHTFSGRNSLLAFLQEEIACIVYVSLFGPVTNCSEESPFAGHVPYAFTIFKAMAWHEFQIWIQMTWKGSLPFKCFQHKVNWTNLTISGLVAVMICTMTCSKSTCQHASASWQT